MKEIFVIVVFLALFVREVLPQPRRYQGFALSSGNCEHDHGNCVGRNPKDWAPREVMLVEHALDEIASKRIGKVVLARAQQRGLRTLTRYATGGMRDSSGRPVPGPGPDAQWHRDRNTHVVEINDPFFAKGESRDAFSGNPGYLMVAQILLHEILHSVDDVSATADFSTRVGFTLRDGRWHFPLEEENDASAFAKFIRIAVSESGQRLWTANRSFALGMRPVRVPTMVATQSPTEAFAEIASHLILDSRAREYLPSAVVDYFDGRVFEPLTR